MRKTILAVNMYMVYRIAQIQEKKFILYLVHIWHLHGRLIYKTGQHLKIILTGITGQFLKGILSGRQMETVFMTHKETCGHLMYSGMQSIITEKVHG